MTFRSTNSARLCAGAVVALFAAAPAFAADPEDAILRGSYTPAPFIKPYNDWTGAYIGVSFGMGVMNANFDDAISQQIAYILRQSTLITDGVPTWKVLNSANTSMRNWGGFVGYNFLQTDRIVVGAEITYNRMIGTPTAASADTLSRVQPSGGTTYNLQVSSAGSVTMNSYGTLKARAGYTAGQFQPYFAAGLAVAGIDYSRSTTIFNSGVAVSPIMSETKQNAIAYGLALALGLDVRILPNMFLRGEWEYVAYSEFAGFRVSTNTLRAGLALKF